MADALVSAILQQLTMIIDGMVELEVRLVLGVRRDVQKLTSSLRTIRAVLKDAEKRQMKEEAVSVWLDNLRDLSYDMDDVLDEWNTAILKSRLRGVPDTSVSQKKVCFLFPPSCFCVGQVVLRRDIALKIKEINEELEDIVREKDLFNFNVTRILEEPQRLKSTSFIDISEICGRDVEKTTLLSKLLCETSDRRKSLPIISIIGMGGIGKTTLAQLVFNDSEVINSFEKRIWVSVSDPFDDIRIAKAIIEALDGTASNLVELESLLQYVRESIVGKKFLLVLDDVWTEDNKKWEPLYYCLKNGLYGSKIMVTTRNETVARVMESTDIVSVENLSKEDSWSFFKRISFFDRFEKDCGELEEIGRSIVGRCKGLPLAIKTIGSLLRFKNTNEQWKNVLDSEMWKLYEFEKCLFSPLLLSYNDLPSIIRRCFLLCAIFPKDYYIHKDQLIKLWMAQGYLGLEQNVEKEIIGQEYFDNLATRSFFQEFEKDDNGNITRCKMHDIVHDFTQFLTKNECFTMEVGFEEQGINSFYEKARHAMLMLGKATSIPVSIFNIKKLRSLLIGNAYYSSASKILPKLFDELTCLRAVDMSGDRLGTKFIKEIPKEIENLTHLRYLNLSKNGEIEELPETLSELYNLETLDVGWCTNLKKLPEGMGKLTNLRHLINDGTSLSYMPKGIGRLTSLRTLSEFIMSYGDHGTVECLKNLNHLRGSLLLRKLGNVVDVGEAERTELKKKKNLLCLGLQLHKDKEEGRVNEDDEALLEALQPPSTLENLEIVYYRGNTLSPNWMMSLTKLKVLTLSTCFNCVHLPSLGKLLSLESLYIWKMRSMKRLSKEFLGIEIDGSSTSSLIVSFPKLKYLEFWDMEAWEEWDYGIPRKGNEDIKIMPCLCSLKLGYCPKLKALPDHILQMTTLEKVKIFMCPIMEDLEKLEKPMNISI